MIPVRRVFNDAGVYGPPALLEGPRGQFVYGVLTVQFWEIARRSVYAGRGALKCGHCHVVAGIVCIDHVLIKVNLCCKRHTREIGGRKLEATGGSVTYDQREAVIKKPTCINNQEG